MPKTRNPRRTVIQGVTAVRKLASDTFKTWNQAQTVNDPNYLGGVTRGLADSEKVENREDAWKGLIDNADAMIEVAGFWKTYAEANIKRLNGEEVDMSGFEGATDDDSQSTDETEDVPLPA